MSGPWNELLPTSAEICGKQYTIRSDYRAVLDILAVLHDPELDGQAQSEFALEIFYPDFDTMPPGHYDEALCTCLEFINGGEEKTPEKSPRLVDWEQDFQYIVAPINRVTGTEVRAIEYMHWWTFLAAYYEIGDCTFAQIVRIRDSLTRGKRLDKSDQEWYRKNRHLVDFKQKYTEQEDEALSRWLR